MCKITSGAKAYADVDLILAELEVHYADPHSAVQNLTQCHAAAGPIPDTDVHKEAALPIIRSHRLILACSTAILAHSSHPSTLTSLYSQYSCKILKDLLPDRIRREDPLLHAPLPSSQQNNISQI